MDQLNAEGAIKFDVDGAAVELTKDDLLITMAQKEGFASQADGGVTVVLDTNLSEELIEEGFAAEVISKIQTMRKDSGFEVMDHITVSLSGNDKIADIVMKNKEQIATKVLADDIVTGEAFEISKEWNVNGEKVTIAVKKN